jgi:hypothetical protein
MKPAPVLATIEPVTATPMEMPNWRALAASAPATPTWSGGSPEMAVLVIGGVTMPAPRPKTGRDWRRRLGPRPAG